MIVAREKGSSGQYKAVKYNKSYVFDQEEVPGITELLKENNYEFILVDEPSSPIDAGLMLVAKVASKLGKPSKRTIDNYFDAVNEILNGNAVSNLEELRVKYNRQFKNSPEELKTGYTAEMVLLSFATDAENRILNGEEESEVYGGFKGLDVKDFRRTARKCLEDFLNSKNLRR